MGFWSVWLCNCLMQEKVRIIRENVIRNYINIIYSIGNTEPLPNEENEELMEMGKPRLGDTTKINIHIIESYEFKV